MSVSGKKISGTINGADIVGLVSWRATEEVVELDATTAADNGYARPDGGLKSLTVEISGVMDLADGDYTSIRAGTAITNLLLYRDVDDATAAFTIANAQVFRSTQGAEIRGRFEISCTIKSIGEYEAANP